MKTLSTVAITLVLLAPTAFAADVEKAEMLGRHGLQVEAKRELIDVIFEKSTSDADRARAYFLLGSIAFEENSVGAAIKTWNDLIEKLPASPEAAKAKELMKGLSDVYGEKKTEALSNLVATSYLAHADFWSRGKDDVFHIDSSWLDNVEAAAKWYDQVIEKFPGTRAAEVAFAGKMRAILGWEEPGRYGSTYGLKDKAPEARARWMPTLLATFDAFEKAFPQAASAQAFRFQIAQAYWDVKDWANTQAWLKKVLEHGEENTFYVDLAKRRLAKLKY